MWIIRSTVPFYFGEVEHRLFRLSLIFIVYLLHSYGDMPAHNLLWRACERSSGSVAARLAVIPLVQVFFRLDQQIISHWCYLCRHRVG